MSENVIIIGCGGHGKVIAEMVEACGDTVAGFLDDNPERTECMGYPVLGRTADAVNYPNHAFVIAIGSNATRKKFAEAMPLHYKTVIHPTAIVSKRAVIGAGTVVMPGAVINACAEIGSHAIINTCAVIEHDCTVGNFAHISPNAALGGTTTVGELTHIGIGASVRNNITICGGCTVGAGAAVVKNIEKPGTYAGVPVKRLK